MMTVREIKEYLELPIKVAGLTGEPVQVPMDIMTAILEKLEASEDDAEKD